MRLVIDGTIYNVGMLSCKRSWESRTLYDVTTLDGVRHRQLWGSYPVYSLTLGNVDAAAYDRLVEQLVTATAPCTVELPSGQTGFSAFTATFSGIGDQLLLERNGERWWESLTVTFSGCEPEGGAS